MKQSRLAAIGVLSEVEHEVLGLRCNRQPQRLGLLTEIGEENVCWARRMMAQVLRSRGDFPSLNEALRLIDQNLASSFATVDDQRVKTRLLLADPVAKYLPAFAAMKVGVERDGALELVAAKRPITIHDLMRHTSGLTYGFAGGSAVHRLVAEADIVNLSKPAAEQIGRLASLPLLRQPGEAWEYGLSTDVLGRVLEVISGKSLGECLAERVFRPLGMVDTAFYAPPAKREKGVNHSTVFLVVDVCGEDGGEAG